MSSRLASLVVWFLAAACGVYWGLRLWSQAQPMPAQAVVVAVNTEARGDWSRLLGADPVVAPQAAPAPVPDTRLTLIGVVSPRSGRHQNEGLALISVDGKPAKTFRVGAVVDGERVLQSVSQRGAAVGPRGAATQVTLSLPEVPQAARGTPGQAPSGLPGLPPGMAAPLPGALPPGVEPPAVAETPPPRQDRGALR